MPPQRSELGTAPLAAASWFEAQADAILREQIILCEIPAPTGQETARAEYVADALAAIGLQVERSAVGNVLARRPGRASLSEIMRRNNSSSVDVGLSI